ncbi:Ig-like domain-containing protein, partial [Hyphobacterium sp. HN65]
NGNTAATQFSVTNDATAPTLAITGPAGPVSGAFTATFTFDEDVTGFVVGDISVGNGAASNFQATSASVYTATITPAADGSATVDVASDVAADAAGNNNTAATQFSVTNDATAPTLAITGPAGPVSGAFMATVTFSEDVTGFVLADLTVGNGAASNFQPTSATVYTATITPAADGAVTLDVAGSVATDEAGNDNTAATQFSITNDETAPTVASIVRQSQSVSPTDADSLVWRVTFSETVVNAGAADFSVTGTTGTVTDVTAIDGASYDITVSGGDLANLNATVTLSFAAAQDIADEAGNTLSDTTPTGTDERAWSVINDADAPTVVSIARNTPTAELTNADTLVWTIRFSEDVTDIDTADFAVSGTTATVTRVSPQAVPLPPSVTGNGYSAPLAVSSSTFEVTASGGDLASYNGVVTLSFAQGQNITDEAGNALTNTTPTGANENSYTLDNTAPTVMLTTSAAPSISSPFTVTATFSEDVTGFDVSDLTVTNGTASNVQATSATVYTATITPGTGTAVAVLVAANGASDAAGNGNTASTPLALGHDPNRTLTVILPGVGVGTVSSAPAGIDCGTDCTEDYALGTVVTLTATADTGSSFDGWTTGPCIGTSTATCVVTMSGDTIASARFTLDAPPAGRIVAATLPGARSGHVDGPVITALMSVVSQTTSPAQSCQAAAPAGAPVGLTYQQLDGDGAPTGPQNPLFDIDAGGSLNFVIAMSPDRQTAASGYEFMPVIACQNASLDPIVGVNSVLLTIGDAPTPDILSIAATPSNDGVIRIPTAGGVGFMTASAVNIGVGDGSAGTNEITMTTSVDTGAASLPVTVEVCQIDQTTAACLTPLGPSVSTVVAQNTPVFFAAFVRDTSTGGIPFDPANSRIFLRFADATGTIRSATSAAVTAPAPAAAAEIASSLPQGRWSVLLRQPDGIWPSLARASLFIMEDGTAIIDDGTTPRITSIEPVAANDEDGSQGFFASIGYIGLWTTMGSIRLGDPWAPQTGEFWGIRDTRSDDVTPWSDLAGAFGEGLNLSETGEIRGNVGGCAVFGEAVGVASRSMTLNLSGCDRSGTYSAVIDLPANDNGQPALLIVNEEAGWRLGR